MISQMMTPMRLARRGPPSWDTPTTGRSSPRLPVAPVPVIISPRHLAEQEQDLGMREVASSCVPPVVHARAGHRRPGRQPGAFLACFASRYQPPQMFLPVQQVKTAFHLGQCL